MAKQKIAMFKNEIITDNAIKVKKTADELDDINQDDALPDPLQQAGILSPGILLQEAALAKPPSTESGPDPIPAADESIITQDIIGICVNIPSPLNLRMHRFFAANCEIKKGAWVENCVQRHFKRCEDLKGDDLAVALQHTESPALARKLWYFPAEIVANINKFTIRNNTNRCRFICSAIQRELEACEHGNGGPYPIL